MSELAYIGVGTNIEPRMERITAAIASLSAVGIVVRSSSIYESAPYGVQDQSAFLNAVVALVVNSSPEELYLQLKQLELQLGRQQRQRWHEREIDFDILFFGSATISTPDLSIPHSDLLNRSFVVIPLREIAPNIVHPMRMMTIEELSRPFDTLRAEELRKVHT